MATKMRRYRTTLWASAVPGVSLDLWFLSFLPFAISGQRIFDNLGVQVVFSPARCDYWRFMYRLILVRFDRDT
ncbi:MAG: hypothetical protein WCS62_05885, partial [Bacilli bacterium]